MKRPVIGITTGGRREGYIKSRHYDAFYSTPAPYVDAVRRAEGIPLLLPPGTENDQELLPLLDGVIVTGGTDIDPAEYDGDSSNAHCCLSIANATAVNYPWRITCCERTNCPCCVSVVECNC